MSRYVDLLNDDVRFVDGLKACMSCGVCTAICPASAVFDYDPRKLCTIVQGGDDEAIEKLLSSDTIWFCGQCMSCRTRCPRGNTPGYVIQALRRLSISTGLFVQSEQGLKQKSIAAVIGGNLMRKGYCVDADLVDPALHPEQGPVWQWVYDNRSEVYKRCGGNYRGSGAGAQRQIDGVSLGELLAIMEVTGASSWLSQICEAEECVTEIDGHGR
jgi:heterodisulfide reductase subunit C